MIRLRFTLAFLIALALSSLALGLLSRVLADAPLVATWQRAGTPSPSPTITSTTPISPSPITPSITPTATITGTLVITEPTRSPAPPTVTPEVTVVITGTGIPSGTIIANRTAFTITFFLEGRTYRLQGWRSLGVALPRATSVLALYNCEAERTEQACFWDPYLLQRDGFYEVVNGAAAGEPVRLILQSAAPPPSDQVWIHNRTGHQEAVIYGDTIYEIPAGAVEEIIIRGQDLPIFYLRHCLTLRGKTVCEWLPRAVTAGVYYALMESGRPMAVPHGRVTMMTLERILPLPEESTSAATPAPSPTPTPTATPMPPPRLVCRLQVAALNVRAGPGLRYLVISVIRRADQTQGLISVHGRNPDGTWLAVDERIAPGGWISGDEAFVRCDGDVMTLPLAEVTDGRLAPTPTPLPAPQVAATPTPSQPRPSPGKALLIAHNVSGREMTFTISPNEWRLQPGESITIELDPGRITFTASTPFHSGNAEIRLAPGEVRELWLHFAPETPGSKVYILKF
ncbi:MAG TPA: hypothetical protein G4O02_12750 [Caldilineae bacterium]|nr:hypothetical protein [Caldilineae bacterium]